MSIIVYCRDSGASNMVQIMNKRGVVLPEHAKYQDADFSDTDVKALMQ